MVWDPTGERLAVIIRGKHEALPPRGLFLADFTPKSSLQRAGSEPQRGEGPARQCPPPPLPSPRDFAPLSPLARELRALCQSCPSSRCSRGARTAPRASWLCQRSSPGDNRAIQGLLAAAGMSSAPTQSSPLREHRKRGAGDAAARLGLPPRIRTTGAELSRFYFARLQAGWGKKIQGENLGGSQDSCSWLLTVLCARRGRKIENNHWGRGMGHSHHALKVGVFLKELPQLLPNPFSPSFTCLRANFAAPSPVLLPPPCPWDPRGQPHSRFSLLPQGIPTPPAARRWWPCFVPATAPCSSSCPGA